MTMQHKPQGKQVTLTTRIESKSSENLLAYLTRRFHYHTEAEWKERIRDGRVLVNGRQASAGQPLLAGDEVAYTTDTWEEPAVNANYRTVHEDDTILVLSKPAPLPVHAIGSYFQNTLMHRLREDRPEAKDFYLVHRLDSETSGLILLAKTKEALKHLLQQWDEGLVRKTYQAIVFGRFEPDTRTVKAAIGSLKGRSIRMKLTVIPEGTPVETIDETPKPSVTEFERLDSRGGYSLIEVRPLTGRTHQIRVHLEHLGFPIVGDKIYCGNDETFLHFFEHEWDDWVRERVKLKRLALHARQLVFTHPTTGKRTILEDDLAEDLKVFWDGLKG